MPVRRRALDKLSQEAIYGLKQELIKLHNLRLVLNDHVYPARIKLEDRLVDLYNLDRHSIKLIESSDALVWAYKKRIKFDTVYIDCKRPLPKISVDPKYTYLHFHHM